MDWIDGSENGGLLVLDYQVNIAELSGDYSVFATGVPTQKFVATGLTFGTIYKFTIQSRNSHGLSPVSDELILLAAFKPLAPVTITTSIEGPLTVIEWSDPVDNGSPITGYLIYIAEHDSETFT